MINCASRWLLQPQFFTAPISERLSYKVCYTPFKYFWSKTNKNANELILILTLKLNLQKKKNLILFLSDLDTLQSRHVFPSPML